MGEDQAIARLQQILAGSEYRVDDSRPWLEQLLAPIGELITSVLARLIQTVMDTASGREGWFGLTVLAVCGALIVAVGVYLVRAVRLSVRGERGVPSGGLAERRERSERLWQTAQRLAAAGEWSEAVKMVYLSSLYALDERALLHVETSLTNREHARALGRGHPALAQMFSDVVERYDRVRYGRLPVTETTFAELSSLVARARSASLQDEGAAA